MKHALSAMSRAASVPETAEASGSSALTVAPPRPGTNLLTYFLFMMTGVGVLLPGNLLPVLLLRWQISDERAGYLFFTFFLTSTIGALLARGTLSRSIARGCNLITVGVVSLAYVHGTGAFVSMGLDGLGLGITMTSISLLQSRQNPQTRASQMARLNLCWALGACIGPFFVLKGTAAYGIPPVLFTIAIAFALLGVLSVAFLPLAMAPPSTSFRETFSKGSVPILLLCLVPLAVGIESSTGSWLATYSTRAVHDLHLTISTVTCFWAGMLLSRAIQSYGVVATISAKWILRLQPLWILGGLLIILVSPASLWPLLGATMLGIGAGPLYPLLIALFLSFGEGGNIVFVLGGVGAAFFPWLTGLVSTWTHSLRSGLLVVLSAAVCLAALSLALSFRGEGIGVTRDVRREA